MQYRTAIAGPTALLALIFGASPQAQSATPASGGGGSGAIEEVVVTAQKVSQNINDVGMSISATSGDRLNELGIKDTSDLVKIVPGFNHTSTLYGTPVYSIRGVGFVDTTLSAGPTVSVYADEVPLPFTAETQGTTLDIRRVEVMKGPQGTLYGQNSTGGAINYIANKPGDELEGGVDASYGSYGTMDVQGFLSGPLSNTVRGRVALRRITSDGWQQSYTRHDSLGAKDFLNGRMMLEWDATDKLSARLTLHGWQDQSENPAPQFFGAIPRSAPEPGTPAGQAFAALQNYPHAPHNATKADWNPERSLKNDNHFYMGTLRLDYDLAPDLTLTSLSSYQKFNRDQPLEGDGTTLENYYSEQFGSIETWYQELRLSGGFHGAGNWIVGANYEQDDTVDRFHQYYSDATSAYVLGIYGPDSVPQTWQDITTYAVFANAEYPVRDNLTVQAGARYTNSQRDFKGCSRDAADPSNPGWAGQSEAIQVLLRGLQGLSGYTPVPPGGCGTMGPPPEYKPGLVYDNLDEDNVSWRVDVNWNVLPETLLYANVSQGYKAGSFPTLAIALSRQFEPVTQEKLLAYEAGFKSSLLNYTVQFNGAAFYYDYQDKQILGDVLDPVFGPLPALVNVPKSHVMGFESSLEWAPVEGLKINPSVSYQKTEIDGHFENYNFLGQVQSFGGESFPVAPKVQADLDVQYQWPVADDWQAFVGAHANYQDSTNAFFGEDPRLKIPSHTLVDVRAGAARGPWQISAWGRNVTNKYYWSNVTFAADAMVRFPGMPRTFGIDVKYQMQ